MKNVKCQPASKLQNGLQIPVKLLSQKSKHFQKLEAQSWEDIAVICIGGIWELTRDLALCQVELLPPSQVWMRNSIKHPHSAVLVICIVGMVQNISLPP